MMKATVIGVEGTRSFVTETGEEKSGRTIHVTMEDKFVVAGKAARKVWTSETETSYEPGQEIDVGWNAKYKKLYIVKHNSPCVQ